MKNILKKILLFLLIVVSLIGCKKSSEYEPEPIIPDNEKMVLLYHIPADNYTIKLPLTGTVDCPIEWGDGSDQKVNFSEPTHFYQKSGLYQVKIAGTVTGIKYSLLEPDERNDLQAVVTWGKTGLNDMYMAFLGCSELFSLADPNEVGSFSEVTDFSYAFSGCYSLKEIPTGIFDNCTKTTSFESTFARCTSIEEIPAWLFTNCPEVISFNSTFTGCTNLTDIPSGLFRGCNKATTFDLVFSGCTNIKELPDQLFTSPAADSFRSAFADCINITEISEELFSRENYARLFDQMFGNCGNLKKIPENLFANCPGAEYFNGTFANCKSLTEIPSGLFDNCKRVKDFITTFSGCSNLQGESPYTIVDGKRSIFMNATEK